MKKNILLIDSPTYPKNFRKYLSKISNGKVIIVKEDKEEIIKNIKEFEKLINPYFEIIDTGFVAFSLFVREIKEFIISCINKKR